MPKIEFTASLYKIGTLTLLSLPKSASAQLPSRSMNMAEGSINGHSFIAPLEPDGKGGHWLLLNDVILQATRLSAGNVAKLVITLPLIWPEPEIPADLQAALDRNPQTRQQWLQCTTKAHWEWLRWINSTNNQDTRKHRIQVALDKLNNGEKRPCCFNRNICSDPGVSRNGVLLDPEPVIDYEIP